MTETDRNNGPEEARRGSLAGTPTADGQSGEARSDPGARNLVIVVCLTTGCLACFFLYLVWKSFTVAAPTVLWHEAVPFHDPLLHRYVREYAAEAPKTPTKKKNPATDKEPSTDEPAWNPEIVERGQRLYRKSGCGLCHGAEGKGGVTNPNYVKDTFPSFEQLAKKLGLEFPEDMEVVVNILASGDALNDPAKIDIPDGAGIISAKYQTVANVIVNGNAAMPKDAKGPQPIFMPSYKETLSESEMNQVLASLLVLYPVEEEEWEDDQ